MPWILLIAAGLLEVAWASVLPSTHGLTRPWPTALFVALLAGSMALLARATQSIPVGDRLRGLGRHRRGRCRPGRHRRPR